MNLAKHPLLASLALASLALPLSFGCSVIVENNIVPPGFNCVGISTGQGCEGVPEEDELSWVCIEGSCEPSTCGDGFVDPRTEECETEGAGNGCQNCQWVCTTDEDCDDGEPCNGIETCNIATHLCVAGSIPSDGTPCTTAGGDEGTCQSFVCTPPEDN